MPLEDVPLSVLFDRLGIIDAHLDRQFSVDLVSDRQETLHQIAEAAWREAGRQPKPRPPIQTTMRF